VAFCHNSNSVSRIYQYPKVLQRL